MDSNGHILEGTSICVDYWQWTPTRKFTHFLSHLHADHTVGLTSTFSENIYTSPLNALLLKRWFNIEPELIISLSVGSSHVMYDENSQTHFSVTILEANHCPGSVMFLFQGLFGNILYTGDFRYSPDVLQHPMMKSVIENEAVDILYLDNTFAAEHCEFPPRQQVLQDIITLIKNHPDHNIILGVRKLGKEEVLRAVALALKEKVWVTKERQDALSHLQYEDVFTTNQEESRIFAKNLHHITSAYVHKLQDEKGPVLIVLLTALYSVKPPGLNITSTKWDKITNNVHYLPYSAHSCHSELLRFVSIVKPHTIYPIVNSKVCNKKNKENVLIDVLPLDYDNMIWRNSVLPESILKLATNPIGIKDTADKVEILRDSDMTLKQDTILSQLTEDESIISYDFSNVGLKPTKSETLNVEPRIELVTTENELVNTGTDGGPQNQEELIPLIDSEMHPQTRLNDDEYTALSEEDLTQLTRTEAPSLDRSSNHLANTNFSFELKNDVKTTHENRDNNSNIFLKNNKTLLFNESPNLHLTQEAQEESACIQAENVNGSGDSMTESTKVPRISEKFSHLLGNPCECDSDTDCFCRAVASNKHKDSLSCLENFNHDQIIHNSTEMSINEKRPHTRKHKQSSSYDTSLTENEASSPSQVPSQKKCRTNEISHKKVNFKYSKKPKKIFDHDSSADNADLSLAQALGFLERRAANQVVCNCSVQSNNKIDRLQSLSDFLDISYGSWKNEIARKYNARAQGRRDDSEEQ